MAAAVSIPITDPEESTSGPPESPGWRAAFVASSPVSFSEPFESSWATIDVSRPTIFPGALVGVPPTPPAFP